MADSDDAGEALDLFQEPDDFYEKAREPTQVAHKTLNGETLNLRLVGSNPLWVGGSTWLPIEEGSIHALPYSCFSYDSSYMYLTDEINAAADLYA